jgi:hypothetical protein
MWHVADSVKKDAAPVGSTKVKKTAAKKKKSTC